MTDPERFSQLSFDASYEQAKHESISEYEHPKNQSSTSSALPIITKTDLTSVIKFSSFGFFLYLKFGESYFAESMTNPSCINITEENFNYTVVNSYVYTNLIFAIPVFILIDLYKQVKVAVVVQAVFSIFYAMLLTSSSILGSGLYDGILAEFFAALRIFGIDHFFLNFDRIYINFHHNELNF